jgi:hypothetical protein
LHNVPIRAQAFAFAFGCLIYDVIKKRSPIRVLRKIVTFVEVAVEKPANRVSEIFSVNKNANAHDRFPTTPSDYGKEAVEMATGGRSPPSKFAKKCDLGAPKPSL